MSGGLVQLIATGAQDSYLTGSPTITFWRSTYRRHTPHAIESVQNTFSGNADFGKKVTTTISRNGDLVYNMYLEVVLPALPSKVKDASNVDKDISYVNHVGLALIKSVEVEIGGQRIDRQFGETMYVWNQLSLSDERKRGYDKMVGSFAEPTDAAAGDLNATGGRYYIPIQFWFSSGNPGQALPIIALQYHETKVSIEFRDIAELVRLESTAVSDSFTWPDGTPSIVDASLYVDYVFLGQEERRKFASSSHEYLITQWQFLGDESIGTNTNNKIRLNFNHPVKSLYWVVLRDAKATRAAKTGNNWFDFGTNIGKTPAGAWDTNRVATATLMLNGHERFSARDGSYFTTVQPFQHHTRVPDSQIFMYSFALAPQDLQPSGSMNFSRTDNATLMLNVAGGLGSCTVKCWALSINVLRIISGMAGLAYSN